MVVVVVMVEVVDEDVEEVVFGVVSEIADEDIFDVVVELVRGTVVQVGLE